MAAKAETASTKTGGDIFLQLLYCSTDPTVDTDRVLDGPTNEKWLYAWTEYLKNAGVIFHQGVIARSVNMGDDSSVKSVTVEFPDGQSEDIIGDYYILAMPVERVAPLINEQMLAVEGRLQYINPLAGSVSWMNGLQYYLSEDVKVNQGHVICSDTEWALTCISQVQFWDDYNIKTKGNGDIRGVLSVDISDWFTPGKYTTNKPAHECTREEVELEVRAQLKASLNYENEVLRDDMILDYYLDRDIREKSSADLTKTELENIEPLLVNTINSWGLRPDADCDIPNLFFAGDYVRTYTDLATMEGANEAARRAVNCIIDKSGSDADDCKIWNLKEPYCFDLMKWYDNKRYKKGLPWTSKFPLWIKGLTILLGVFYMLTGLLVALIKGNGKSDPGSTKEKLFIIGTMVITLGFAIFDAVMDMGYGSAFWLAIGMFSLLTIFAIGNKDD